jgi:heme-degrading monooxygenase HmoA
MIIREWRGWADEAEAYPAHFRTAVLPQLRQVPGFLGAYLSRRSIGDKIEYLVLTKWASMDSIRAFAGGDFDKAVVEPGARAALADFDSYVQLYEVIEEI